MTVINTHGHQVVDTWAFAAGDTTEYMSMEHSRVAMLKLSPQVGDTLVTNRRRPILTVVHDNTPGIHDTLIAACDTHRYLELGGSTDHDNCTNNLASALARIGRNAPCTPCPLNLFMNVGFEEGQVQFLAPTCEPGQFIAFKAEMDLIAVFSACPQDLTAVNNHNPADVEVMITPPLSQQAASPPPPAALSGLGA